MGHLASKQSLMDMQRRLDKMPIGTPSYKALFEILQELFTDEECQLASVMPFQLATAKRIAKIAKQDLQTVEDRLRTMVEKGLVMDLRLDDNPRAYYYLNPAMIGFFEFTMMKKRKNIDQAKVAHLMWEYIREDPQLRFFRMATEGPTFLARPLVNELALEPEVVSEVLDYEKASYIVEQTHSWAEAICHCRHVKQHMGKRCRYPLRHCLSFGLAADALVRANISKPIEKERALDILQYARDKGCVQMGDNVKNQPTFICNCCKCCCEMMEGFRTVRFPEKVITSNYEAELNPEQCRGCGRCARACPVDVIDLVPAQPNQQAPKRKQHAQINQDLCLGCGVCQPKCRFGALTMRSIGKRTFTPENAIAKIVAQAVEHGKLGNLIFDDHTKVTHRAMAAFLNGIIQLPPTKQLLAQQQIKSTFLNLLLEGVKRITKTNAI